MADPVISDAMVEAFTAAYDETEIAIVNSVSAETMDAQREATAAGLRAAIARWNAEQRTLAGLAAQQGVQPVRHVADLATPGGEDVVALLKAIQDGMTNEDREDWRRQQLANRGFDHYLSTACWHERHDYCAAMTGYQGVKRPAQCKWCDARCECDCHSAPGTPALAGAPGAPPTDLQTSTDDYACATHDTCRFDPRCPNYADNCRRFEAHETHQEGR